MNKNRITMMRKIFLVAAFLGAAILASLITYMLVREEGKVPGGARQPVTFRIHAPEAKTVFVAGSFNAWQTVEYRLEKKEGGFWETTVPIAPGRYEYKFLVDTVWVCDADNPIKVPAPLPYTGYNSVLEVRESDHK
jgi:1,4-alpha-glucan branching enzyme